MKSENKDAKEKIDTATQEIIKLKNQIKNDQLKVGFQFDLVKKQEDINTLQTASEEKTWKIKNDYYGGDRILEFCLDGKMGSKKLLFDYICKIQKPVNKPEKTTEDLKKEAEVTQGENAKTYDENLVKKVSFDFWKIEKQEIFKEVIIGNENSQVAELINKDTVYVYPNPALGDITYFKCYLGADADITVSVFNIAGEIVAELKGNGFGGNGVDIPWNIKDYASGVYIFKLQAISKVNGERKYVTKKMAVVH